MVSRTVCTGEEVADATGNGIWAYPPAGPAAARQHRSTSKRQRTSTNQQDDAMPGASLKPSRE